MQRNYAAWHGMKEGLSALARQANFSEREVWWCALGVNVGYEEDGKNHLFERPILVIRKYSKDLFMGMPLSTAEKESIFYHPINVGDKNGVVILSQARSLATERLLRRIGRVGKEDFASIVAAWTGLINKSDSLRSPRAPSGDLYFDNNKHRSKSQQDENSSGQKVAVSNIQLKDIEAVMRMHAQSWLDTYPNKAMGITRQWMKDRVGQWTTPEGLKERRAQAATYAGNPDALRKVAKCDGKVAGILYAWRKDERQHLGALYVAKEYHGKGVGQALMQAFVNWEDARLSSDLEVATYNERAKAFYRKYGFVENAGSEHLFAETIPVIDMVRKGEKV